MISMLPGLAEIIGSLNGAFLLAKRDLSGYQLFNLTIEGFWRSFAAILLIAPVYFLFAGLELDAQTPSSAAPETAPDNSGYYFTKAVALGLDWIAYPIIMVLVSRGLGFSHRYVPYIIAFNWSSVIAVMVMTVPPAAYYLGAINAGTVGGLNLLLLLPVLYYRWFIARTALETSGPIAAGLVLLELTVSVAIAKYTAELFA